jgi:tetratricopeptide (TPR) repeat protein
MKKIQVPLFIAFLALSTVAFAGDDKAAISNVIENESKAYLDKDYDAWAGYWLHEPYVSHTTAGANFYSFTKGWEDISAGVKKDMHSENRQLVSIEKGNTDIHINGSFAQVFVDEKLKVNLVGEVVDMKNKTSVILQKVDGDWKIVSITSVGASSYENNDFNTEWSLNMAGYQLLQKDKLDEAIKVFELNTQLFPDAFNTWDSLAEAYMKKGNNEMAVKYYKKSLNLNANNSNAQEMLDKIQAGS